MLLRRLEASMSSGAVGSMTKSSALTGSATASQSSTLGPPSTPCPGTDPWYLDSGASFHMIPHFAHLFALHLSYHHCTVHTVDGSFFLLMDRAHFVVTLFMSLMFHLFLI
jgi:hypothetical protein